MKIASILLCAIGAFVVLEGCQDDTAGSPPPKPMTQAQLDRRIAEIQDNPKIPEAGKEIAVKQMKAAYEMMKARSGSPAESKNVSPH